jgi:hypothetical protein
MARNKRPGYWATLVCSLYNRNGFELTLDLETWKKGHVEDI